MPVYSHQMVFPCNKDPVQILPIQLKSHLKFHIDRQILMLNNRQEKHPLTPSSTFFFFFQQLYFVGRTQLVYENQGVTRTAQNQDDYVLSEDECPNLLYQKLYYCIVVI